MRSSPWARRLTSAVAAAACALAVAVAVAVSGELSAGALLAVGLAGSAVVVLAAARRSGAAAPPVGRRGLPWLAWCAAALGWELVALAGDGQPSLSDLADPLLAHPGVRGAATLGWLAAGAWLIARPRARARP